MDKIREENIIKDVVNKNQIKRPILKNSLKAFLIGGLICLFGEIIRNIFIKILNIDEVTSNTLMLLVIITVACFLTGFGIYDKIGQHAGAGTIIPISGFANSMTSSAIESKSEGFIQGILNNVFKLAGPVIATSIFSSTFIGLILYLLRNLL